MIRNFLLLALALTITVNASAQAVPASRIGAEIAGVVKSKVAARGFAANDPRFGGTVSAIGTAVVQIATAVVVTGTAPAWGSVLATALIAGAVGYAIQALTNWIFNSDGTVTYIPAGPVFVPSPEGSWIWRGDGSKGWPLDSNNGAMEFCLEIWPPGGVVFNVVSSSNRQCVLTSPFYQGLQYADMANVGWLRNVPDPNYVPPDTGNGQPVTVPASTALQSLSEVDRSKPLPPKVIADLADAAFRHAASQPGYAGIPYSMADPITEADVAAFRAANPTFQPATIGDLAAEISPTDPLGETTSPTVGTPTNPAASSPLLNLGADPGIGSPNLESTPTGTQILQPLRQLVPDLRNFQVPAHQAVCPKPTFEMFGKSIVMDGQCAILEGVRGELYNAMVLAFVLVALLIVLSA